MAALPPELRLLHACYHAVLGDWPRRLVPHRDVVELVVSGRCDFEFTREVSRRWKAEAILATGIRDACSILGLDHDSSLARWAASYQVSSQDESVVALYNSVERNYAALSVASLRHSHGLRAKSAFVRALLLPDRAYVLDHHASAGARLGSGVRRAWGHRAAKASRANYIREMTERTESGSVGDQRSVD
jgi:hypothetical protein